LKSGFVRNFLLTGSSTVAIIVFSIVNNIVVTRWIGVENRGIYGVALNLMMFMNLLFGEGVRRSNTVIVSEAKESYSSVLYLNLLLFFVLIVVGIVLAYFYGFFYAVFPNIEFKIYVLMIISAIFFIMWNSVQGIYLGLGNIIVYNLIPLSAVFLIMLANVVGIYFFQINLEGIFLNILIVYLLVFLIPFLALFGRKSFGKGKINFGKDNFFLVLKATFSSLGVFTFKRSNIFFVNNILGAYDAGLYSVANIFSDLVQKLPNVAGILVFSDSAKKHTKEFNARVTSLVRVTFFLNLIVILVLFLWGREIIELVFGAKFGGANVILEFMLLGFGISAPTTILHAFFMGKGFPREMVLYNTITAILAIVLNFVFVKYLGVKGAGISYSLSFLIWGVLFYAYYAKFTDTSLYDLIVIKKSDFSFMLELLKKLR
jgi:O-antigen/teichoic acid export membrane protein